MQKILVSAVCAKKPLLGRCFWHCPPAGEASDGMRTKILLCEVALPAPAQPRSLGTALVAIHSGLMRDQLSTQPLR